MEINPFTFIAVVIDGAFQYENLDLNSLEGEVLSRPVCLVFRFYALLMLPKP